MSKIKIKYVKPIEFVHDRPYMKEDLWDVEVQNGVEILKRKSEPTPAIVTDAEFEYTTTLAKNADWTYPTASTGEAGWIDNLPTARSYDRAVKGIVASSVPGSVNTGSTGQVQPPVLSGEDQVRPDVQISDAPLGPVVPAVPGAEADAEDQADQASEDL